MPVVFRTACMPAETSYLRPANVWSEFVYLFAGAKEARFHKRQYLVPSPYGLWLLQGIEHQGLNYA